MAEKAMAMAKVEWAGTWGFAVCMPCLHAVCTLCCVSKSRVMLCHSMSHHVLRQAYMDFQEGGCRPVSKAGES